MDAELLLDALQLGAPRDGGIHVNGDNDGVVVEDVFQRHLVAVDRLNSDCVAIDQNKVANGNVDTVAASNGIDLGGRQFHRTPQIIHDAFPQFSGFSVVVTPTARIPGTSGAAVPSAGQIPDRIHIVYNRVPVAVDCQSKQGYRLYLLQRERGVV